MVITTMNTLRNHTLMSTHTKTALYILMSTLTRVITNDHEEGSGDHDEDYVDVYAIHKNPKDGHDESEDVGDVDYSMMKVARRNF